jgi:predicted DNA-binding protein with PD1-like motif
MQSRIIDKQPKTYALIFETGDEVAEGLASFAQEQHLSTGHFTAIGGFQDVVLGYFDWKKKEYERIPIHEQVEVLSLIGDIALDRGTPKVHAHVIIGKSDGTAHGGHLVEAHVRPTLEVIVIESAGELRKSYDPLSKLDLIKP